MGAILMERANAAKAALKSRLGRPPWLRGIGIGADPDGGLHVKVNVAALTPEVRESVPETLDGVPVRLEAVGEVNAMPSGGADGAES